MMNMNPDDLATGVNGRLRPRKPSIALTQPNKIIRKSERNTGSKTKNFALNDINLQDETRDKSCQQFLCLYCSKKFFLKQSLSQHLRRTHFSTSKQDLTFDCSFCNHKESGNIAGNAIIKHMIDCHPNQYFACCICNTRFSSTSELASHRSTSCENQKLIPYHRKLRPKSTSSKKEQKPNDDEIKNEDSHNGTAFGGVVISCELKPSQVKDATDIENSITTNLILPSGKNLTDNSLIEKSAIILLDDIQWSKSIGSHFSFHNADTEQILSRLGVVHKSPRTSECTRRDWYRIIDESTKFEKCFDTGFYSRVASNVQENLTKFLDGSFTRLPSDSENVMKTRKAKNNVVINTVEGFPTLLAPEQCSRIPIDSYSPRAIAPKHKWKWDNLENENMKNVLNQDKEKRDSHASNCIVTSLSRLDIWTQLCMRRKYEAKFNKFNVESKTIDKQNTLSDELKEIIESREIPHTSSQMVKYTSRPVQSVDKLDFPASLGLIPAAPKYDLQPAVFSGEWARPRCYVCCACGEQTSDTKALSSHISNRHPNAQIEHYEIVGEHLLNADILKHLYVPPRQVFNRTRPLRGSRECTKCKKSVSFEELHQHMLECAGDTPVIRRRSRYRPFGVRRRRPRLPDNRIRKRMRKDIRNRQNSQKTDIKPRNRLRTEVGDAETIRKMLADLPPKRHRVTINPNPVIRSQQIQEKRQLLLRRRVTEDVKNNESTMKSSSNIKSIKVDGDHVNDSISQARKKCVPLKASPQKLLPSNRQVLLKRTVKKTCARQLVNKNQSVSNPETPQNNLKQIETCSTNNDIITEDLSLNIKSDKICFNNNGDNARECSNRDNGNHRDGQQSRNNEPSRNNFPQNNGPTHNAPLKHSIARLTSVDELNPKYVQYPYIVSQENYITTIPNIQYMPTGQPLFFENEIAANKLDKPPLCDSARKLDVYGYQKNKLNKPKKGLNDCIAMLKNKLVDTNQNQQCSISPMLNSQKEDVISESFTAEFNGNENDYGSMSLLQTHTIPLAHTNVPSLISTPLDLSGKNENLDSTYGTSLDLSVKSTTCSNDTYMTLDLSTKSLSQSFTVSDEKTINTQLQSNTGCVSNDVTLNLCTKTTPKSNNVSTNSDLLNSTKTVMTVDVSVSKDATLTINESKATKNTNMGHNVQKDVIPTSEVFGKGSIDDQKKSVVDKRSSEKTASKQLLSKFNEKASNQKPVYDPTLKIPQYKIRANTDFKNNDKESEKPEQKQVTSMESGSCSIELLPKEIVDILGTMPVQHRNKLLNVLPQVFAKTVKQLKLAVDLNITKETITSPNKSEIATQTSSSLPEQICPPEFVNVDTDKFLIDPVTGAIIERTNTENENFDCLQNEKTFDLLSEDKKDNVKQELSTLKINTDLCLDYIDPSGTTLMTNSGTIKQKVSNDQTASLRAVRIKSANVQIKSSKNDCVHTASINEEKLSFEDTNKASSPSVDLKNKHLEVNAETTLAIQQFEVTSTQQNNCSYKQLSPSFIQDIQKSVSPVSGPILESSVVHVISNSNEDLNLHSNGDMKKDSSDTILHKLQFTSHNTNTIKTNTEEINHQIVNNIDKSPNQDVFKLDNNKALSSKENDQVKELLDTSVVLKDTDASLKSSSIKSSTQNSMIKQNDIALCESDDDDPEDDISLATILKRKVATQEKRDSAEKIISIDSFPGQKSLKKTGRKKKGNDIYLSEKIQNHEIASVKRNKNKKTQVQSDTLSNRNNVSTTDKVVKSFDNTDLIIMDTQLNSKKGFNKKKLKMKAETKKLNFNSNKEINQGSICKVNIKQIGRKSDMQENNQQSQSIESNFELKENTEQDNGFKMTTGKELLEEQSIQSKGTAKKQNCTFNTVVAQGSITRVLKNDDIECKKSVDENKTNFAEHSTLTSPINKCSLFKVTNLANDCSTVLSKNREIEENYNLEVITNRNTEVNVNDDKMFDIYEVNIDNDETCVNVNNESQDAIVSIYKLNENKIKTQHTIEEIIKPHNLSQPSIQVQPGVHGQENQIADLMNVEVNPVNESHLPNESEVKDIVDNKISTDERNLVSKIDGVIDSPLRRSKRGKSFYAESYMSSLGDYFLSDNSCLQHKTPLTKKQVIFSKLLLDVENQFKPSNDIPCSVKKDSNVLSEESNISSKTETIQSPAKPTKRKISVVKKKMKKKRTIEEIVQARTNLMNSEKTIYEDNIVLPSNSNISKSDLPIKSTEIDKIHDHSLGDNIKVSDNDNDDLCSKIISQDVPDCQVSIHNIDNTDRKKSNKRKKSSKNVYVSNEKLVKSRSSSPLEINIKKRSTSNSNESALVLQQTIKNDHSQVAISIPRLNIRQSLSDNNKVVKSAKRKLSKSDKVESDDTSKKSKISKLDSLVSLSESSTQSNSENDPPNKNILITPEEAEALELLDVRKTRTKSNMVRSYSDIDYQGSYYDFDDDSKCENDFSNDLASECAESVDNSSKRFNNVQKTQNKKSKKTKIHQIASPDSSESFEFDYDPLTNGKADIASDSDDSMQSDVPLKKYADEIAKYGGESSSRATVSNVENKINDVKESNKDDKHQSLEVNDDDNTTDNAHTEEELRSEQFMESFGFFSERKPRKSNLLATKKISETFHIISNENDDIFLPAKNKSTKKTNSTESNKKNKESDSGNSKVLKKKRKKTPQPSISKKPQKKRRKKRRHKDSAAYCIFCRKDFERVDNYLRHKITLLHISRVSEVEMQFNTIPFANIPNHLVAYKHHIYKLKKRREKMARDKKKNGRDSPIEPFILPTLAEVINKPGTSKSKANKGKACKGKGKKSNVKKSKSKKLEVDKIETNKSETDKFDANDQEAKEEKSDSKEQESNNLEPEPGCSSQNIARRGLSRDEALFLDCCELLKESHKTENLSAEASHSVEEGKESLEVKSFECASHLNSDEKVWGKNEDEIDPITAKSILESEEVRNLENDLICGLKEAVSNVSSSLVNASKTSKEFASNTEEIEEFIPCSENQEVVYAKEKNCEISRYSKELEIVYSNEIINEMAHCSNKIEVIYSNDKQSEHCSEISKTSYLKGKTDEMANNLKNLECSQNADINLLKSRIDDISHSFRNPEIVYLNKKMNEIPYNSKNTNYLHEKCYEVAHCSKSADVIHSNHKEEEMAHFSNNVEIIYSNEKNNENSCNSKSADMYSQEQSYEISHCSTNKNIVPSKYKTKETTNCSNKSDFNCIKEKFEEIIPCSIKEKNNGNAISSKNKEMIYLPEKIYETAHCSKNADIYLKQKRNETVHCSKKGEIIHAKEKNNRKPCSSKNSEITFSQDKSYEIAHCSKSEHNVHSIQKTDEIAHCSKNTETISHSKEKISEVLPNSKDSEITHLKQIEEYTSSENAKIMYHNEKNNQITNGSKNEESVHSKEGIKEIGFSSANIGSLYLHDVSNEHARSSKNVDVTNFIEKNCEITHNLKNVKFMYSKDSADETAQCPQNSELIHSETTNEVSHKNRNTEPMSIKEKGKDNSHGSKNLDSMYTSLDEMVQNVNSKHSEQIKSSATPETKQVGIFEDKFDIIKRKCRSQAAAAKNLERSLEIQNSHQLKKKSDKKAKSKKNSKKNVQSAIVTKGALKEFDGIKVSIPTSDIKMSTFAPAFPDNDRPKKKKKNGSKKKKEKSDSSFNAILNFSVPGTSKDTSGTVKQTVDVYEFMDNEDTDMFDFRSKRLDRFKNTNKDLGHCSKTDPVVNRDYENSQHSSISGSDVDDFVYMSDDYVCSADETENSLLSCELGTVSKSSSEGKKNGSSIKRKDSMEKNAVMGKIFKHNALRNERKNYTKAKETKCLKTNLDQLFDSLLENEPNSSLILNENAGSKKEVSEPVLLSATEISSLPTIQETEANRSRDVPEEEENEAGVARQRARRKCTVGKQNVLAESWSSESEGESGESDGGGGRRRAARPQGPSRRARRITFKPDDNESRVCSNVSTWSGRRPADKRSRSELAYYWSSPEEADTRVEQHGWIVGDSHKKLVTMLAHAKGRKRDDRRHFVE